MLVSCLNHLTKCLYDGDVNDEKIDIGKNNG